MKESTDTTGGLMTAEEVAQRLNVKRATIYAYVSRGLLERKALAGIDGSLFDAMEVERLAGRSRKGRRPGRSTPIFRSAITTLHNDEFHYRGHRACRLAQTEAFENVAHLLWIDCLDLGDGFIPRRQIAERLAHWGSLLPAQTLPFDRVRAFVPLAATLDPMRHDLNTVSVVDRVSALMATLVEALTSSECNRALPDTRFGFAQRLWSALCPEAPTESQLEVLNAALILTADADVMSPTTVAARFAASVGSDIYSVIGAGMHSSGGAVQSASSLAIESYLGTFDERSIGEIVGERLRQGQALPGFGHPRFSNDDKRATLILEKLTGAGFTSDRVDKLSEFLAIQRKRGLPAPNIGFAIAALAYVARMIRGSGDMIFAIGRTAGWTAHAIEQYSNEQPLPRPPSLYVGRPPISP